jgi:hypothetical protein
MSNSRVSPKLSSKPNNRDVVGVLKAASEERGDILGTCFSLTHGTAFSLFAAQIFRMLEDEDPSVNVRHPGPVTLGSLKQYAAVVLLEALVLMSRMVD